MLKKIFGPGFLNYLREIGGALRRRGDRGVNFDPIGWRFAPTYHEID
ncbi:hypothetical protein NOC27_1578 [Nitrosococcus oceani AFC27]|nr:hypothetical protein NOC27_1578 [Nitrosococcus oceani AFC27]